MLVQDICIVEERLYNDTLRNVFAFFNGRYVTKLLKRRILIFRLSLSRN